MGIRESYLKKQSAGFVGEMEGFLAVLEDRLMDFKPVKIRTLEKTEEELIHLFYFKFQDIPILARMDAVMEYLVDEYETLYNRNLPEDEVEEIREKFNRMYVTRDIYKIYNWFWRIVGMRHWQKFRMRTENSSMKTYFRYFISNTECLEEPDISISSIW